MKTNSHSTTWLQVSFLTAALLCFNQASALTIIPPDPSTFCVITNANAVSHVIVTATCETDEEPIVTGAIKDSYANGVWVGHFSLAYARTFSIGAWSECQQDGEGVTITVAGVAWAMADAGTEVDDGDNNPNTRTYEVWCGEAPDGVVTVSAGSVPSLSENKLPGCWSTTGGSGTSKLYRTISGTTLGTNTVSFYAGSTYQSVKVIVRNCD